MTFYKYVFMNIRVVDMFDAAAKGSSRSSRAQTSPTPNPATLAAQQASCVVCTYIVSKCNLTLYY